MSEHHFWLSDTQLARLKPLLPNKLRGVPRVDDQRVISGIIHVLLNGLLWRDAPERYGPPKTLYNRFIRWSKAGVFDRIFAVLASGSDATHLKAHRTAASLLKKGIFPTVSDARKGGLNSKLHTACDRIGRPLFVLLSKEQVSDYRGAASVLSALPNAKVLIAAKGYTSNWFQKTSTSSHASRVELNAGTPETLQAAQRYRTHVRQTEGRTAHCHPIRPMRPHLHERNLHRRHRYLLIMLKDRPRQSEIPSQKTPSTCLTKALDIKGIAKHATTAAKQA